MLTRLIFLSSPHTPPVITLQPYKERSIGETMIAKDLVLRVAMLVAIVSIGGCATAYQPKSLTGGFSETDLGPTRFKIAFSGNGFTSAERASDFAILRAADKSIEDGCNYFTVVNESDGGSTSSFTTGSATFGRHSMWANSFTTPIFKPNSTLLVRCFARQTGESTAYDAHFIAHSIRNKYQLPEPVGQAIALAGSSSSGTNSVRAQPESVAPTASSGAATNIAQQVLAAQRVALGQGCGDVAEGQDGDFQASCSAGTLIIQCDGDSCIPTRMKHN